MKRKFCNESSVIRNLPRCQRHCSCRLGTAALAMMGSLVCWSATGLALASTYASWDWSTGSWTDVSRWSCDPKYPQNGQPGAGETYSVSISAGNVARNISPTISQLDFSGGTISGSGILTVNGPVSWSGGRISGGAAHFNGGTTLSGNMRLDGASAVLTLGSGETATLASNGAITLENQSALINAGTLVASTDTGIFESGPYQTRFQNDGTMIRQGSSGVFTVGAAQFLNHGTLQIQTGTLSATHGITNSGGIQISTGAVLQTAASSIIETGSSFSGQGLWEITSGEQHLRFAPAIPNPVRLASAAKISVYDGQTLQLQGPFEWNGGTLSRESLFYGGEHGFITSSGGMTIADGADFTGLNLRNASTSIAQLAAGATLSFNGDAILENLGTLTLASISQLEASAGSDNSLINTGVITAAASIYQPTVIGVELT